MKPANPPAAACLWCGRAFTPRATGGKRQVFCRPFCRRALDAAGRRYIEVALADGALTVVDLKNAPRAMRALLPGAASSRADDGPRDPS
jgi:hypothetical protein